ncbi:SPASM domain-containing protein [Dyadobacter chenwenxiniae]|uniref:SPASM domain-containing protein n=1 Tax=Dyadobacter chenwenxiniae TaxID=2906456 RepID=A0A9X1THF0_9BACT|nr:radical SAM protein [Dyadobacter chenwenxiniae]MCF0064404.1 SPASM domain-containing protein [Dyadobacter chenwenxiniae]UON82391.1 SPASM domain-containing protein [Dyadobacter chenwenxiniae]
MESGKNYKLSHYTVVTDTLENDQGTINKRMMLATRTARVMVINNNLYDKLLRGAWDEVPSETFSKLLDMESVVPISDNELQTVIGRNQSQIHDSHTLNHVIQPTAMCQLGCGYCGQSHTKNYLDKSAGDRILERIEGKFVNKEYRHVSISWFGSEPLVGLSQIRELTPKLKEMAARHACTYSSLVVTNGLSLKEHIFLELVKKHNVTKIEVTLDGTAEYHDARRHTKAGLSTFDLILKNLLVIFNRPDFKELGCSISIRCNVDGRNEAGVVPLIKLLASYNLQDKIEYFYVARIHSWGNEAHLLSHEKEDFAKKEIDWILTQYQHGFRPGLLPGLHPVVCISVTPDSEVFDAFGNVFDCTETPYVDTYADTDYVLGNVNNGLSTISKYRPLLSFNDEVANGEYPCSTCKMLPVCGGGCPKSWREGLIACPTSKFNVKDKLVLSYALRQGGVEALADF